MPDAEEIPQRLGHLIASPKVPEYLIKPNDYIVDYEHPIHGKMKLLGATVKLSETPSNPYGRAPEHGEHTEQVLTEVLGYSWEDVDKLRQSGAI